MDKGLIGQQSFARQVERYCIVAWLREQSSSARLKEQRMAAYEFAEAIERGDHLSDE